MGYTKGVDGQAVEVDDPYFFTWLTLYAQHLGDGSITLPYQAKSDESQGASATQQQILTRRPMPSDLEGIINEIEKTTQSTSDNTTVIDGLRFFLDEKLNKALNLNGTVRVRTTAAVKTNNVSGTAHLQQIVITLKKLTAANTYTSLGTQTVTVNITNATTAYAEKSVVATFDLSSKNVETGDKLLVEITTNGKITNASYVCTHRISFDAGTSKTYAEIGIKES
jgi:ribosomal protein L9